MIRSTSLFSVRQPTLAKAVILGFALLLAVSLVGCFKDEPLPLHTVTGKTMGTTYMVSIASADTVDIAQLQEEFDTLLQRVDERMSTYNPDSLLSQFNSTTTTEWFEITPDIASVVDMARRVSKDTGGAYDVTLGTVVDMWGFGAGEEAPEAPALEQVLEELYNVGHQLLVVSRDQRRLRKLTPNLKVDLSSIAKGYAVDQIGTALEKRGFNRYMVEIGGEIRTRGQSPTHQPWQIAIESPDASVNPGSFSAIAVENAHIATSGDYRNYREVDGVRFSHIIDGRSGFPIDHNLASVTVLHGTTMQADAWATAFMVMGATEALKTADAQGLPISVVIRENGKFVTRSTSAFEAYQVK